MVQNDAGAHDAEPVAAPNGNPLRSEQTLPYGLPDFAAIDVEHVREAILQGMADERDAWEAIATDATAPDVPNTVEAVSRAGIPLERAAIVLATLAHSVGDPAYLDLEAEIAPLLQEHRDAFWLDKRMYHRYVSMERALPLLDLEPDHSHHVRRYADSFRRSGVLLEEPDLSQLRELNTHLVALTTDFSRRVTEGRRDAAVLVDDADRLAGLSDEQVASLRAAAQADGLDGYLIDLVNTSQQPPAAHLHDRALRAELLDASLHRSTGGTTGAGSHVAPGTDTSDTRATLLEIVRLRAVRARLLGYENHAALVAAGSDAGTTDAVDGLLTSLAGPAVAQADAEIAELRDLAATDPRFEGAEITAADLTYLFEKQRRERYDLDDEVLRPYLELDRVLTEGVFHAAEILYGLTFAPRADLAGYAPGVRVWEVFRESPVPGPGAEPEREPIGLFVADVHARPGKRGGAWAHALVRQSRLLGTRPVIVNNLNVRPAADGQPVLLTWDEVRTCFHEFGHALHGLLSDVRLPSQSGTSVRRDTVEFPSQINEIWMTHPRILSRYAVHHATGEPLPEELLDKMLAQADHAGGFKLVEHVAAVALDQAWHRLAPEDVPIDPEEVEATEKRMLAAAGLDHPLIPPRYRSSYFMHTFGGGYDAGYYSYLWAEMLDADTAEWFASTGARNGDGGLNRRAGEVFRAEVLSRGGTREMAASFHALRGRDVEPAALLARHRLTA